MRSALTRASRKRLNADSLDKSLIWGTMSPQSSKPDLLSSLAHNFSNSVQPSGSSGPKKFFYSSAGFNAHDISSDHRILQVNQEHCFSAVLKSNTDARGGGYLRQHLYQEFLAQQRKSPANFEAVLLRSIAALNQGFQSLHPFNLDVLQGVQIVVAHVDFARQRLQVASNGGCRCVVGRALPSDNAEVVEVIADIGHVEQEERSKDSIAPLSSIADIELNTKIDYMILGSTGFWTEVAPFKAILRLHHIVTDAPYSSNGSAAANIINYTLHRVTQRMKSHSDRRMVSLNSVSNLVSLHTGSKGQFKYGHKQPVRRRRGDVHGDLTTMVAFFDWQGLGASTAQKGCSSKSASRWDTVRMVIRFIRNSRRHNQLAWQALVQEVSAQIKDCKAKGFSPSTMTKAMTSSSSSYSRSSAESSMSEASVFQHQ